MPDEKAGNPFYWKDKLDGLDFLPGEAPVDKEAGWQQLQDRLQKRPRKKKKIAYWIAAACLVGVMLLTKLRLMQPEETLVKRNTHPAPQTAPRLPATGNQEALAALKQTVKNNIHLPESKNKLYPVVIKAATTSGPVPLPDTVKEILPETIPYQPADTVLLITAAPKKKLRVVHINEVNRPEDDTQLASNDPAPSSAKFLEKNSLPDFSVSRNVSDNIIKIKISSSN